MTVDNKWAARLANIDPSHLYVVATVPLRQQLALRKEIEKLLDPRYERFNLQEAFLTTWGQMAAVEEDEIMFIGCPMTIWSRLDPPEHGEVKSGSVSPLPAEISDLWPDILSHIKAKSSVRTTQLKRQLGRVWTIVTREWRHWCWRQVVENIWKGDMTENRLAEMLAAGLEDAEDLQMAVEYMMKLPTIARVNTVIKEMVRLMNMPLPSLRIRPGENAAVILQSGYSVYCLEDAEYLPRFSRHCVLLATAEGLVRERRVEPEVQWH